MSRAARACMSLQARRLWCRSVRGVGASVAALTLLTSAARAQTDLVIVSGLGGQPKYVQQFADIATTLADAANARGRLPDSSIIWLGESAAPKSRWFRGVSTRENVEATLSRIAARAGARQLVLVLVGHGAGEGSDTRISLPGPDLTGADFTRLLTPFSGRRVAVLNLASGSGDMLRALASPGRVVITATKSSFERNESRFASHLADAFSHDAADTDKDGRVSLLEAFRYADTETQRFYENAGRLATEHAQLADSGQLAARFFLTAGEAARATGDPRLAALYAARDTLDARVQALKARKHSMSVDEYERELERLLLELAATSEEIRKLEKGA